MGGREKEGEREGGMAETERGRESEKRRGGEGERGEGRGTKGGRER
jgi:hypothetical protein